MKNDPFFALAHSAGQTSQGQHAALQVEVGGRGRLKEELLLVNGQRSCGL